MVQAVDRLDAGGDGEFRVSDAWITDILKFLECVGKAFCEPVSERGLCDVQRLQSLEIFWFRLVKRVQVLGVVRAKLRGKLPAYIHEGLAWLAEQLKRKEQDVVDKSKGPEA